MENINVRKAFIYLNLSYTGIVIVQQSVLVQLRLQCRANRLYRAVAVQRGTVQHCDSCTNFQITNPPRIKTCLNAENSFMLLS